jgi:two-component system, NarL family, nitrate/nitrite response regulator NarL
MPETSTSIRLMLLDDHALFREALAEKLNKEPDIAVVSNCGSAAEALGLLRGGAQPTMILLDFDLGAERVIDFLGAAKQTGFAGHVLVVTAGVSGPEAIQLIKAGVRGILHKHNTPQTLCDTIRQVNRGEAFLEKAYLNPVFRNMNQTGSGVEPHLTERDKAILRFVFEGLANKEIAGRLQVSEGTIKSSVSQLFQKLGVRTRAQLVKVALEQYGNEL